MPKTRIGRLCKTRVATAALPPPLSRRAILGLGLGALAAGCTRGASGRSDTLYIGDQRGSQRAVLEASGNLANLAYTLEWSAFPNAAPLLEALNADAIDTGFGGDAAFIFAIGSGATIKAIGAQKSRGQGPVLVVRDDSSVRAMTDIAGRRIATPRGSIGHNLILAALEAQGRPLDAVRFVFLSPQDGQAALQAGAVDGWAIWDPNAAVAERQGARIVPGAEELVPTYALLFARDGAIDAKRTLLTDYYRRLRHGWAWAVNHPDAYARRLHQETGIDVAVWQRVTGRTQRIAHPIDEALIADQQRTADRYLKAGLIQKQLDVRMGFDKSFTDRS